MRLQTKIFGVAAMTIALLLAGGCEQTAVVAPSEGSLSLQASTALIVVTVLDQSNIPQADVSVLLTTSGGILSSSTNACGAGGTCTLTVDSCVDDDDCPTDEHP